MLAAKLSAFVALPIWIWRRRFGYSVADLLPLRDGLRGHWRPTLVLSGAIVLFQALLGRARPPGPGRCGPPLRAGPRARPHLRPELMGEGVGTSPSLLLATSYSIVYTSVSGLYLGVLWLRTRNLWVVAVVHAAQDWLPTVLDSLRKGYLGA